MIEIEKDTSLRYQIYGLNNKGNLRNPITRPILRRERANKYFSENLQCALVSIDEHGSIVEIIDKNTEPIKDNNNKPKTIKRNL